MVQKEKLITRDELINAIKSLTPEEREKLFDDFEDFFRKQVSDGSLSRVGFFKLKTRRIHLSEDRILDLVYSEKNARITLLSMLKSKQKKIRAAIKFLEELNDEEKEQTS